MRSSAGASVERRPPVDVLVVEVGEGGERSRRPRALVHVPLLVLRVHAVPHRDRAHVVDGDQDRGSPPEPSNSRIRLAQGVLRLAAQPFRDFALAASCHAARAGVGHVEGRGDLRVEAHLREVEQLGGDPLGPAARLLLLARVREVPVRGLDPQQHLVREGLLRLVGHAGAVARLTDAGEHERRPPRGAAASSTRRRRRRSNAGPGGPARRSRSADRPRRARPAGCRRAADGRPRPGRSRRRSGPRSR
jgi:hypothetical protein